MDRMCRETAARFRRAASFRTNPGVRCPKSKTLLKKSTPSKRVPQKQFMGPLKTGGGEESIKLRMGTGEGGCRLLHLCARKCELPPVFRRTSSARFRSAGWSLSIAATERLSPVRVPAPLRSEFRLPG